MGPWRAAAAASPRLMRGDGYRLLRCSACGSAALAGEPAPPSDEELYEAGTYRPARRSLDRPLEWLRRLFDRDRLRLLGDLSAGQSVVELGAGRGRLVAALQSAGVEALGIEPSPSASAAARDRGARVENCSIEEAVVAPASTDLVVLWHVLEHLEQPAAALVRARPWIADGGRIVIATPNLASLQARLGGDRWFHQDVPRHRTLFTAEGLVRLLRRSGFAPVRRRQLMIDQSLLGMWLALLNRLTFERDVPFRFLKRDLSYPRRAQAARDAAITLTAGPLLFPVALALELAAALARRGGSLAIEARVSGD
jgi:SAM-dependent methyltransferase